MSLSIAIYALLSLRSLLFGPLFKVGVSRKWEARPCCGHDTVSPSVSQSVSPSSVSTIDFQIRKFIPNLGTITHDEIHFKRSINFKGTELYDLLITAFGESMNAEDAPKVYTCSWPIPRVFQASPDFPDKLCVKTTFHTGVTVRTLYRSCSYHFVWMFQSVDRTQEPGVHLYRHSLCSGRARFSCLHSSV